LIIVNSTLSNCGIGIWINGGDYILISGNVLTNCNLLFYGAAIDINLNAANVNVEYNTITMASIGINLEGAECASNIEYGNFNSCATNFVNNGQGTITTAP
jgi:nitrous oxidase accessory protein NosD